LQLGRDASAQDVRRQFRKFSVKLHPDKNPSANTPQSRTTYEEIQTANEWLSKDDKRQLYDLYGPWTASNDRARGHEFAGRHSKIEFFRDDPLIRNVRTEAEAQDIFGLKTQRAYLMLLYAPWLTSCMEATDVYRRVASHMREETGEDGIRLAAVNCESNLQKFCLQYGRLRNQYELPVVLLLDPTESLIDRYRGRMVAEEVVEYAIASDKGIQHVNTLDEGSFELRVLGTQQVDGGSEVAGSEVADFWLVLFCTQSEPMCRELKPVLKRLAYSAKDAVRVGLVNCRQRRGVDGYLELEPFCQEQGVQDVPTLLAYRRGARKERRGEVIPLLLEEHESSALAVPLLALRAMEAVLKLSSPAPIASRGVGHTAFGGGSDPSAEGEL
jgi:thioredoxin-like negative regulator of GroEL